jgi:hypothetical protein
MTPTPHVCCRCKREVVMTDCLPAVCYKCQAVEAEAKKEAAVRPDFVVREKPR